MIKDRFNSTVLGLQLFTGLTLWILECSVCRLLFYCEGIPAPFCELFALTGYKFVGLSFSDLLRVSTTQIISHLTLAYCAFMMSDFMVI